MQPGLQHGCFTALITPFHEDGSVDYPGLEKFIEYQIKNGVTGILAAGTTGESSTLSWDEHMKVIDVVAGMTRDRCKCIAGTGSNNTTETLLATDHAAKAGCDAVLMVDPYYNGPSSIEIRHEYIAPVAREYPDMSIIPYVIPGRTGTQLLPEDLALLYKTHPNVHCVKEATGDPANMKRTRQCCGEEYTIYSGDDGIGFDIMTDPEIRAVGMISVMSNIIPGTVTEMVNRVISGNIGEAARLNTAMAPLFGLVTVTTREKTPYGDVSCRARNPLPVKALMHVLGIFPFKCRRPLGKMTRNGLKTVLDTIRQVYAGNPWILDPIADFFNVDLDNRINDPGQEKAHFEALCYPGY